MNDRSVRIAICIKDRVARQLACSMFSSAGAEIQVCDDAAAIKAAADGEDLQAVVLGLGAAPEPTFDALVLLRQWFSAMPIYVIADAAGARHAKRTKAFGATQVIPHEELQRRVGQLIRTVAQTAKKDDWDVRPPGWAPGKGDDGYEVQSMDLGAWLSIPGNRRLLDMKEPPGSGPAGVPGPQHQANGAAPALDPVPRPRPPITANAWAAASAVSVQRAPVQPAPVEPGSAEPGSFEPPSSASRPAAFAPPSAAAAPLASPLPAPAAGELMPCGMSDCARLTVCRVEHDAQNAAILEAQKQREKRAQEQQQMLRERMQAELRAEFREGIAASRAQLQDDLDERLRREVRAAVRRLNRLIGLLAAVLVLLGAGLVWRLGPWW